jgi:bifunctional DNA-binding transcriptional regulator/antitoxin component of YhaV-PrlF toxin-antitoxin module
MQIVTSLTQRSQVTLPVEVRKVLGLMPRDKVAFIIDGSEVRLKPARYTLESVAGSVEPMEGVQDFDEQIRQAKEERVQRTIEQMCER